MTFESRVFWMVDASNKCQPIRYLNRFFQIKNIRYASSFLSREFDTGDGGIDDVNESNAADNVSGDGDRFHDFWVVSIRRDSSQRTQIIIRLLRTMAQADLQPVLRPASFEATRLDFIIAQLLD